MSSIHFLNGTLVSEQELLISPRDLGYSRGYAVFDFLITKNQKKPFMLKRHIDRLFNSAQKIELGIPWSKEQIIEWVLETLRANNADGEKVIRITISGGISLTFLPPETPTISIIIDPAITFPSDIYEKGVTACLVEFQRYEAEAKTNNYIEAVRNARRIQSLGVDELIFHSSGIVREGSRSNLFAVIDGKLYTPKSNLLQGVTRGVLLDILKLNIPIEVEDFSVNELRAASEVFYAATGREIVPITRIDNSPVGDGTVGPVTKEAMRQYRDYVNSGVWE